MSEALRLPVRPHIQHYRKLAKELRRASQLDDAAAAVRAWAARFTHSDAPSADRVAGHWIEFQKSKNAAASSTLAAAQFFIARQHAFASWPKFVRHLEALALAQSPVSAFEQAADAIVSGDFPAVDHLLRDHPELVRARSTREHRSTLLHYVSANGVEDFRQKTPSNILEITRLLLDAGSDVNAESGAYGGGSTTLRLTATSRHPEDAGLQLPLLELLIERGAVVDAPHGSTVNSCFRNGRGEAAAYLAERGAGLDLEGASGVGSLDRVANFFSAAGSLLPPATPAQMTDGFAWACQFGKTGTAGFLLQRGVPIDARLPHNGQTGLHWAAYGGHPDTVDLLLERGAPIDVPDGTYRGTPLDWALHALDHLPPRRARGPYYEVVERLIAAGAALDEEGSRRAGEKFASDPRLAAALLRAKPR